MIARHTGSSHNDVMSWRRETPYPSASSQLL